MSFSLSFSKKKKAFEVCHCCISFLQWFLYIQYYKYVKSDRDNDKNVNNDINLVLFTYLEQSTILR